jgi:hypothetical protein
MKLVSYLFPHHPIAHNFALGIKKNITHLQVLSVLPGSGGPHAILRPRQNRHASGGFFSRMRLLGNGLRRCGGSGTEASGISPACDCGSQDNPRADLGAASCE